MQQKKIEETKKKNILYRFNKSFIGISNNFMSF